MDLEHVKTVLLKTIKNEIILVSLLTIILQAIAILVQFCAEHDWTILDYDSLIDIDYELEADVVEHISAGTLLVTVLGLIVTPFAIYFSATNDRLTFSIRLLATVESICKFVYIIAFLLLNICDLLKQYLKRHFTCSENLRLTFIDIYVFVVNDYSFYDLSQFYQLIISLSRFFAVSFDGSYFKYTTRLPFLQVLIPFVLRILFTSVKKLKGESGLAFSSIDIYIIPFLYFLTCALDLMTNRKMKTLRRNGKATRTENLLMFQMLCNTFIILINTIFLYAVLLIIELFFGLSIIMVYSELLIFLKTLFFMLITSLTSALFLRKPKENPRRNTVSITVSPRPSKSHTLT